MVEIGPGLGALTRGQRAQARSDFDHGVAGARRNRLDDFRDGRAVDEECWLNRLRGRCGTFTRELDGEADRSDQVSDLGASRAGEVEGGAVIDRGAHDRQAEGTFTPCRSSHA